MARLLNVRPDNEVEPELESHLLHLRKRNQTQRSVRERRLTVLRVARKLGHPVAAVTREGLIAWQDGRLEELEPAAMHNEVVHVGQYLKWLHEQGRRNDDPSVVLVRPQKLNQRNPKPMPDADIARALATADQPLHVWIGLGAFCGLRCMEMAKMRRDEIVDAGVDSYLRVIGKGNKERRVPLPASLRNELASGPFSPTGYLFSRMDGRGGPPSAMRVSERINDHLAALGIPLRAHSLRHRFGTELYRVSKDPFYVAEVMGHASIDTTHGYVRLVNDSASKYAEAIANLAS